MVFTTLYLMNRRVVRSITQLLSIVFDHVDVIFLVHNFRLKDKVLIPYVSPVFYRRIAICPIPRRVLRHTLIINPNK